MIKRFDTGTDVAMIGAWDASRADSIQKFRVWFAALDTDSENGDLFRIDTGGDGSWLVEVRLDEAPPDPAVHSRGHREVLLKVPTGLMNVGGVEDYRSSREPKDAGSVSLPSGEYGLRLYFLRDPESSASVSPADEDLLRLVSPADLLFTKRWRRLGCSVMLLSALSFPFLAWRIGFVPGAVIALTGLLGSSRVLDGWPQRDPRTQRVKQARRELSIQLSAHQPADSIFELKLATPGAAPSGGAVQLEVDEKLAT